MLCPICNKEIENDFTFCPYCSSKLNTDNQLDNESNDAFSRTEETSSPPDDYITSPTLGSEYGYLIPTHKMSPLKKALIFPVVALILAIAIILGALYSSAFSGPVAGISRAINKTLNCSSFSFEGDVDIGDKNIGFSGTLIFELDKRILEFFMRANNNYTFNNSTSIDNSVTLHLKDGILKYIVNGNTSSIDYSSQIKEIFDEYESTLTNKNLADADWKKVFEVLNLKTDHINFDTFGATFEEFLKNLNDKDFINKKIADYSKDMKNGATTYSFDFEAEKLSEGLMPEFEKTLVFDANYTKDYATRKLEDNITEFMSVSSFGMDITTSSGYLTELILNTTSFKINLKFKDFGKAVINENLDNSNSIFS